MSEDLRPAIIGVNTALILITLVAIGCRIGRKITLLSSFGWHDALATFGAISAIIFSLLQINGTRLGGGLPMTLLPPENKTPFLKLAMGSMVCYFVCNWAVKHSLLFFYSELTFERWHRRFIYIMHVFAFSFGLACVTIVIFQCLPVKKMWNSDVEGHCIDLNAFSYFNAIFMLVNDLVLYVMPVIFTWHLCLRRTHRIAVNCLFALGGLVIAASIARVYFVHEQATKPDFPYRFAAMMICAVIENHLAVIVACAPSIKAVLVKVYPDLQSKFEKILSDENSHRKRYRTAYRTNESATLDVEADGIVEMKDVEVTVEQSRMPAQPSSDSTDSTKSNTSRRDRWWRAPSDWAVISTTTTLTSNSEARA